VQAIEIAVVREDGIVRDPGRTAARR